MPGVYIAYPFCRQKCTYCNFASGPFSAALEDGYLRAVHAEIAAHDWRWRPQTLYLGGGTPSAIDPDRLERLLSLVPGRPWAEATLEASPGDIDPVKVARWKSAGIDRVSLGVQSFVAPEIARTGRRHNAGIVQREVALLREGGIANFNIDLIAGLPGQTPESWRQSLDWVERLGAPHVSVYMLEIDEDSRLGREILRGGSRYGAGEAPSEDLTVELYELAVQSLAHAGLYRYEISNFARPGSESAHNLKYWRLEPYAAFGADAHSFDGEIRRRNVETVAEYVERFANGESPLAGSVPAIPSEERFFVGLRLAEGIRPLAGDWDRFDVPIRRFLNDRLLERDGDTLRLTPRGILLSNEVFGEFIHP